MEKTQIEELEDRIRLNPEDIEALYGLGLIYLDTEAWLKAYDCFQRAEVAILDNISGYLKSQGRDEPAGIYYNRARNIENKELKLTPSGSHSLRYFLLILGITALICFPLTFILWSSTAFIIPLIILLIELMIIIIFLPILLVIHYTSRKKEVAPYFQKLQELESEINNVANIQIGSEFDRFMRIEKLKAKQARMARTIARIRYTESIEK